MKIINILDVVTPLKKYKAGPQEIAPWEDDELMAKRTARNHFF